MIWALTSVVGGLAVLITGRYPKSLWTFNVGVLRWFARVWAYAYFLTDKYPPFSGADLPDHPVRMNAEWPENGRVERWRGIFAPIVALPFTLLAAVLDAFCLLLAWIPFLCILFTRHNPRWIVGIYSFTLAFATRSAAYATALVRRPPHFRPNMARALWGLVLGILLAAAIDIPIRALQHYHPVFDTTAILIVALLAAPLCFLVGLGGFDYWFYWASGRPTRPEDHSGHGAHSWKDYFRINTDHKVIGIQYMVTSFFFLLVGGLLAMLMRAELAAPGMQFVDSSTFNGLFSVHASILIFLFIIPVFAGIANYVLPLMIGAPDMAFPRLNALSYWLLPLAGTMMLLSFFAPGGSFATGWTAYAPLSTDAPIGQMFFTIGVQFAGASSVMTALNFLVTIITMRAPGMSFWRMPLLVWANFSTSLLVVIATPFIAASQFFVLLDRALGLQLLRGRQGRRRAHVPARLLVLLAPGGLHHDAAGLRDHLGDPRREVPQTDLRLPDDGLLAAGHRGARLHGLGAPHVRLGHAVLDPNTDDDHHRDHRRADRDQDLLVAGDAVARGAAPRHADAVRAGLPDDVRARRDQRGDAGDDPDRHPRLATRTSSSPTSTTCCSADRCSRSSPASTTGSRR